MAYPNITNVLTGQKPATIKKVYVNNGTEKWQMLGKIRNGELKITPNETEDTLKKNLPVNSLLVEAKFELLQTTATEIEALPELFNGVSGVANGWLFQLSEGVEPTSGATAGWVNLTASQALASGRYVCDGNPSSNQFVEVIVRGTVYVSASNIVALVTPTLATADFHLQATSAETFSAAGAFASYLSATAGDNTGIVANVRPCGFVSVALDNPASAGAETLSNIRNGKIELNFVAEDDTLQRPNVYAIDINVEYESTLTDSTTLLLLDDMLAINQTSATITLIDGKTFTLASQLGFNTKFENIGDYDKLRVLRFSHKGRIPISATALDSIVA